MIDERPVRVGFIGCGAMARYHPDEMLGSGLATVGPVGASSGRGSGASGSRSSGPAGRALRKVRSIEPMHVWRRFLDVRAGREPSSSPPEVGLRMARLWDAIQESAARGDAVIRRPTGPAESAA